MISICIASKNQGPMLAETIDSVHKSLDGYPHEVIVVDDASEDGSADDLPTVTRKVTNDDSVGCSTARAQAAELATGDVIIISDPHCTFPPGSLAALAIEAEQRRAIIQPIVHWEGVGTLRGGGMSITYKALRMTRPRKVIVYPGCYGSIYAMSRETFQALNGLPVMPGIWGRYEPALTIMAYRLGIEVDVLRNVECVHRKYDDPKVAPYERPSTEVAKNAFYFHAMLLPDTFRRWWRPILAKGYGCEPDWQDAYFDTQKDFVDRNSQRDEWQVLNMMLKGKWREEAERRCRRA